MSQDSNLFGNYQPSPFDPSTIYHPDITSMQFAASVPPRPSSAQQHPQQQQLGMNFTSFPNQDVVLPHHPTFSMGYLSSPYERPDSSGSSKQLQTKAERRAEHNATERARRESLNVKFQQLAFTLPNLQNDSRPSKGTIIDRTLDFVKGAIIKEERMQYRINELEKFSRYLLSELDKKNSVKEQAAVVTDEIAQHHPITITAESVSSPHSIHSEDSFVEEIKSDYQPSPPSPTKKENGITNRRPVSRTSVPMIPKLDYTMAPTPTTTTATTNWPITSKPSNYHHLLEQQLLIDQQLLLKEQPSMPMTNTIFQHSFNPTTTPTTNLRFGQQMKYSEPEQQFINPDSQNYLFNGNNNTSFHPNLMEMHHRR
ncbi:unnamed protein product [Mucor hiemalis]